jgi:hypothetical protein
VTCGGDVPCYVFVTDTAYTGNLGGVAGADTICQNDAVAHGLPGTYKAWLSNHWVFDQPNSGPITRFTNPVGPYERVDGVQVSPSWTDLITVPWTIEHPINLTAGGVQISGGQLTWTNTYADGKASSNNLNNTCQDWTSADGTYVGEFGMADETSSYWSAYNFTTCDTLRPFYCFQQSVP